ncbi:hypothetical protein [Endozoicomonas sp.]|uniref:hypothetical protein n=1 Tax=Endozoicomonas sp. TaxID=1892382 RepID=UPI003AF67E69
MELQKTAHTGEQPFSGPLLYDRDISETSEVTQPQRATPFDLKSFLRNDLPNLSCQAKAKLITTALETWTPEKGTLSRDLNMLEDMKTLLPQMRNAGGHPPIFPIIVPDNQQVWANFFHNSGYTQQGCQVIHGRCETTWTTTTTIGTYNKNREVVHRTDASGYFDQSGFHSTFHQESSVSDERLLPTANKEIANLENQDLMWVADKMVSSYCATRPPHEIPETKELLKRITTIETEAPIHYFRSRVNKASWHYKNIGVEQKNDSPNNGLTAHERFCKLEQSILEWDESKTDDFFSREDSPLHIKDTVRSMINLFALSLFINNNGQDVFITNWCENLLPKLRQCFTVGVNDHGSQSEMSRVLCNIDQWTLHFKANPPRNPQAFSEKLMGVCTFMELPIAGKTKALVALEIAKLGGFSPKKSTTPV